MYKRKGSFGGDKLSLKQALGNLFFCFLSINKLERSFRGTSFVRNRFLTKQPLTDTSLRVGWWGVGGGLCLLTPSVLLTCLLFQNPPSNKACSTAVWF